MSQPHREQARSHMDFHQQEKKRGACEGSAFFVACDLEVQRNPEINALLGEVIILANVVAGAQ